jgi:tetratricopeptide (TPR) repeat protein
MARRGRRDRHAHDGQVHANAKRSGATELTVEQQTQVDTLAGSTAALAGAVRAASTDGRPALIAALTPIKQAPNPVAEAYATRLGDVRGRGARDAADVAHALGELDSRREVARAARRSRMRLGSAGTAPSLVIPSDGAAAGAPSAPESVQVEGAPERAEDVEHAHASTHRTARLVEAYASRTRETGEMTILLAWQESLDLERVRAHVYTLSFWDAGVKHFTVSEPMTRARFAEEVVGTASREVPLVAITHAQARRLVLEALAVNEWRNNEPAAEFQLNRRLIEGRLLAEAHDAAAEADRAAEDARFQREGDRLFIGGDLEPDETIANWIGAWAFGDFGLAYDLCADDNPVRRTQSREDYGALRHQWSREAQPAGLRLSVVREQAQRAGALWVPGAAGTLTGGERKDYEAFWSLIVRDSQVGGQIEELPMGTLTSADTGRHWYWTGYTLARDPALGLWLISRLRDDGAASQALKIDELQRRIQEAHTTVEQITQAPPPERGSDAAAQALRTITGTLAAALHYYDALIVHLPLDESLYRTAANDARSLGNHERAAALLEKMRGRFADDVRLRFELGVEQYLASEQYLQQGEGAASAAWLERAVATMQGVAEVEPTAEHLQGLGELLARQGHYQLAEARLREAIALEPQRAALYSDLADTLMGRIAGENLDNPMPVSADEREAVAQEALGALREAVRLDSGVTSIFTRMGAIYEVLGQQDDALVAFEEAIRRDPGDADAHHTLGSLFLARNNAQSAVPHLETAVQLAPLNLSYRLGLAAGYVALNRRPEAERELNLIDSARPGLPQVAELRAVLARHPAAP